MSNGMDSKDRDMITRRKGVNGIERGGDNMILLQETSSAGKRTRSDRSEKNLSKIVQARQLMAKARVNRAD